MHHMGSGFASHPSEGTLEVSLTLNKPPRFEDVTTDRAGGARGGGGLPLPPPPPEPGHALVGGPAPKYFLCYRNTRN